MQPKNPLGKNVKILQKRECASKTTVNDLMEGPMALDQEPGLNSCSVLTK